MVLHVHIVYFVKTLWPLVMIGWNYLCSFPPWTVMAFCTDPCYNYYFINQLLIFFTISSPIPIVGYPLKEKTYMYDHKKLLSFFFTAWHMQLLYFILSCLFLFFKCFLCNIHTFPCYQDITKNDDFKVLTRNNSTH